MPVLGHVTPATENVNSPDDSINVVTGSRIEGLPSNGPVQTISIGRDDIIESGAGTVI